MTFPHSSGYSLLEVLVALLVLSAGVIGAAALQLSAWQLTHQSHLHTVAQQLAAEMSEWMQVLDDAALDQLKNLEMHDAHPSAAHCYGRHCDADGLLHFITADWIKRAQTALPQAQVRICRDAAPWDSGASSYRWECASSEQALLVIKLGWLDKQDLDRPNAPLVVMSAAR